MIDFAKDCLKIKDKVILNQADEYKIREGNSQKNNSVNALKTKKSDKNPGNSHWLSPELSPHSDSNNREKKIENNINSENHPPHIELGLKKPMSEYTLKDIPQLPEEIAELFSDLLGLLPLELPPLCEVLHKIPLIDESKQLKHRL